MPSILDEFTSLYARTDETHDPKLFAELPNDRQKSARGIEVGQIFYFGTKYSEAMGAYVADDEGSKMPVHMGSHGMAFRDLLERL